MEKGKQRNILIALGVVLALLLFFNIVMCFYIAELEESGGAPAGSSGGVIFDPGSEDERPGTQESVKGPTVKGFSSLTIPSDVDTIAIDLYNPIENSGLYYLTFELRLPDDSEQGYEVLFKTDFLAPGKHIYQVTLSHSLQAGEYETSLLVQPYRMKDVSPTNNVSAAVKLTVKSGDNG